MTNIWYASDWDQAYRPSYAKICRIVVRHIQVHLYTYIYIKSGIAYPNQSDVHHIYLPLIPKSNVLNYFVTLGPSGYL